MFKTLSAKYYQENKERLQKKACERSQNLSKEKKEKKTAIWFFECYKNLSEDEKQKLFEYRKNIIVLGKMPNYNSTKHLF